MENKEQYKALLSEIIAKQIDILGPDISVLKARAVPELQVTNDGKVTDYQGEGSVVVHKLIDKYVELSGLIVKNALGSILMKYPNL